MIKKIISVILIIAGLLILGISLTEEKVEEIINAVNVQEKLKTNDYYAILEIPKINLNRVLYPVNHEQNHVDKNLFLHSKSVMPDNITSNVIIAGHSGGGVKAYFKDLEKLEIDDLVTLYFNGFKYTYQIKEKEYQNKTGTLYLKTDYQKMLTLITCTTTNKETQTIYYAELILEEKIANV